MEDWAQHKKPCKEVAATKKKLAEEEEARSKAAREAVTNPTLRLLRQGVFRDVHELHGHALLQQGLPARALAGPQDPLQGVPDLQGEPGAGSDEEEARGARAGTGGGP